MQELEAGWIASLEKKTGRTMDAWIALARGSGQ